MNSITISTWALFVGLALGQTQSSSLTPTPSQLPSAGTSLLYGAFPGRNFGTSVSLSSDGSTLVVGVSNNSLTGFGAAYVYSCSNGGCGPIATTLLVSVIPNEMFGTSVVSTTLMYFLVALVVFLCYVAPVHSGRFWQWQCYCGRRPCKRTRESIYVLMSIRQCRLRSNPCQNFNGMFRVSCKTF